MKKIIKNPLFTFIIGGFIFGSIGVFAANTLAKDITYNKNGQTTVEDALNDLYSKSKIENDAVVLLNKINHKISKNDVLTSINLYKNSSVMTSVISDSQFTDAILKNNDAINTLDLTNPIVSNDTSKCFASTTYSSSYSCANAFSDNTNYWGPGAGVSYNGQYIGYDFGEAVWVYKMVASVTNGKQDTDYVLEGSNDNESYTIIKDGLHQHNGGELSRDDKTIIPNNYNTKYRYYRIRFLSDVAQSGSGNTIVNYIKMYAKK